LRPHDSEEPTMQATIGLDIANFVFQVLC